MRPAIGVLLPNGPVDVARDARRAESLQFDHAVLSGGTTEALLALGATRRLPLYVDGAVVAGLDLPEPLRRRLRPVPAGHRTVPVDPTDLVDSRRALTGATGLVTAEVLVGPHDRQIRKLALDVLRCDRPDGGDDDLLYAEDLTVGQLIDLGESLVLEDELVEFCERWDPLDFHTDREQALDSPLGTLCGSGIYVQAHLQRLSALAFHRRVAVVAGRGGAIAFRSPLLPGMRVAASMSIDRVSHRPSGRSVVDVTSRLRGDGRLVFEGEGQVVILQRDRPTGTGTAVAVP